MMIRNIILCLIVLFSIPTYACLHPPHKFSKPVKQAAQEALILHDGDQEDLIISINYQAEDLTSLAWVIPVPTVPTNYGVEDASLFTKLSTWVNLVRKGPMPRSKRAKGMGKLKKVGIKILPKAKVGPFEIQPIQGVGDEAVTALQAWFKTHDFAAVSKESLQYYTERHWTFLAVKITPTQGSKTLANQAALPPLRITFPTKKIIYPLKFSTHMGIFAAKIYILSAEKLSTSAFKGVRDRGFEVLTAGQYLSTAKFKYYPLASKLHMTKINVNQTPKILQNLLKKRFGDRKLYLSILLNEQVNETKTAKYQKRQWKHVKFTPSDWPEDLSIPGVAPGERLMTVNMQTKK